MLHESPLMADIDVGHWRNLQDLVLDSAKEKRRIIVIHEHGEILKLVHSRRAEVVRTVERVSDPVAAAESIYRANAADADLVLVLERRAVDRFFAKVQDSWRADEDLDEYVHRMFATLDEYPEAIVTYPGPARSQLGLQWRVGASYEEVKAEVERLVPPATSVVFGVFAGDELWTSLVLGFDAQRRISVITTADPTELSKGLARAAAAAELVSWVESKYPRCSLGLFVDVSGARAFLSSCNKLETMRDLSTSGQLFADPAPESLARVVARA